MKELANKVGPVEIIKKWGFIVALLGWFLYLVLPQGPGITFDSVSFLQISHHLIADGNYLHTGQNGLEFASERFPLYIWLIAPFAKHKIALIFIQTILFLGSLLALNRLIRQYHGSVFFLLFFGCYVFLANYYSLWTEGLYGLLLLSIIGLISNAPLKKNLRLLLLFMVLLCLTRLVGVVVGIALGLAYILKKNNRTALLIFLSFFLSVLVYVLYSKFFHESQARFIHYNPITAQNWVSMPTEIGNFILPVQINATVRLFAGCILSLLPFIYLLAKTLKRKTIHVIDWFLCLHFYGYIAFIWICIAFIDACIPVEFRTLFPLYINLLVFFIVASKSKIFHWKKTSKLKFLFPVLVTLLFAFNATYLYQFSKVGTGYNSASWDEFSFTSEIEKIEADIIYTNDQAAVNYYSNYKKQVKLLNEKYNLHSLIVNSNYKTMHDEMIRHIQKTPGLKIIWVRNGITADIYPSYEELKNDKRLNVLYDDWLCLILEGNY